MENRQYSHQFPGLEKWVYNEITPTILDVPAVRTGHDPIQKKPFGITLNVWNFRDTEVRFSLLEEKFLRFEASHTERKYKNHTYAHRCTYFFYVPDYVIKDRLVVEWYRDHRVHISERYPEPFRAFVFADDSDDEKSGVTPRKRGKKDRGGESSSSGKDVASQTASKESAEPEEVAMEVESASKESEAMVKDVSSQTTLGSERESGPEEGASEMETLEEEEDVSVVKEVLSQIIAGSEKESGRKEAASEMEISEEEEDRIIVEELLSPRDGRSRKKSEPASGDKDLSAQSTSSYEKESMPKEDSATEEVESMPKEDSAAEEVESMPKEDSATEEVLVEEVEKEQDITLKGWKPHYDDINKLLQNVDKKAAGRTLKPVFVDKDYRPKPLSFFDAYRDSEDLSIRNQMFMRNVSSWF